MKAAGEVIEVNREEVKAVLEQKREALGEKDYHKLQDLLRAFSYLADLIGEKDTTISQLRALLMKSFASSTLYVSSSVHRWRNSRARSINRSR